MTHPPGPYRSTSIPRDATILTVAELNHETRRLLETGLGTIWITGEISNLARPRSGHWYFSLKDADAQVRCAMFRNANRTLRFDPADGLQVILRARVTIYEPRGDFQLVVEHMEPAGEGLLRRQFEELKTKLAAAGLFDEAEKTAPPPLPRCIGLVTSPTGAAVRDILQVLGRRFPAIPVILYPVQVQGEQAKHDIVRALGLAADRAECDVLIVGRGGGSLEDLWAFNEEIVVRAIHACPIPVISAVGHEVDFTLADLAADLRAPTPSAAAELVVPDGQAWLNGVMTLRARAARATARLTEKHREQLRQLDGRLARRNPVLLLEQHAQRLDELTARIGRALRQRIRMDRLRLGNDMARLKASNPRPAIREHRRRLAEIQLRMASAVRVGIAAERKRLAVLAAGLQACSPLDTLRRGYAIVEDRHGRLIHSTAALRPQDEIVGRLADGRFTAVVDKILPD